MPASPRVPVRAALLTLAVFVSLWTPALADEYDVLELAGAYLEPGEATVSTRIGSGQDDTTVDVDLPFSFAYFGALHDRISVCSNGWLAVGGSTSTASENAVLPSGAAPDGVVAPLWDDLRTGSGTVRTFVVGQAPSRVFVVDWNGVDSFDRSATGLSFQAQLNEQGGSVIFAYGAGGTYTGLSYTSGIESPDGAAAYALGGFGNTLSGKPAHDVLFLPPPVTMTGRLLRDRPVADATGLGNSTATGLPVAGTLLQLVREDTGDVSAVAYTDASGRFALSAYGLESPTTLRLDVRAEGRAAAVRGTSGDVYLHTAADGLDADPATDLGDLVIDAAVDTISPPFRRALNIQQALERGRDAAVDAATWAAANIGSQSAPDTVPLVRVLWTPGVGTIGSTSYTPAAAPATPQLFVTDADQNPDPWDDDVLLRNYGQHVLASLSAHPGPLPIQRGFAIQTSAELAWADGFGYWFAAFVKGAPDVVDTLDGSTAVVDSLESPPESVRGTLLPGAVAASLWDLSDPANESEDNFEGDVGPAPSTAVEVLGTIDRFLDALPDDVVGFTAENFFNVWRTTGATADRIATARIFIHHGTLSDDAAEPDDLDDEATLVAGSGFAFRDRRLTPFNEDRFRLEIPEPVPQRVDIGLLQTTETELDVELLTTEGASLAFGSTVGAEDPSTLRLDVLFTLQPGTYFVRVTWRGGEAAAYDLSLYSPLLVTRGTLPEWTVGIPFKEDLGVGGGVEPYTLETTTTAPGLVIQDGTRVTGTPSLAGDHEVEVSVRDAASPQNVTVTQIPLRINGPLGLPTLLALPEGADVDLEIGRGGTGAIWLPVSPQPAPLTVVGGTSLRLTGSSGGVRSFEVNATASDAVGATLDAADAAALSTVVVTGDLFGADEMPLPEGDFAGWYVDALEGSEIDVRLRFRGQGRTPEVPTLLDEDGQDVSLTDARTRSRGRKLRVSRVEVPRTGRYHLIVSSRGFQGTVTTRPRVRPPRRVRGQAAILESEQVVETTFDALAGSRVKLVLLRSPSPTDLKPTVTEIIGPDATAIPLPTERRRGRGRRAILRLTAPLDGRYTVRMSGLPGTTGPLQYRVKVKAPRGGRLDLD